MDKIADNTWTPTSSSPSDSETNRYLTMVSELEAWFKTSRFKEIHRLYTPQQVAEQKGSLPMEYPMTRQAAKEFYVRLRHLFNKKQSITTFGPYSPSQAVAMKRQGIEGIYLGGWATSAKGGITENPGPDLASYPLSQVPDEASPIVRALLTADQNQSFARRRMNDQERQTNPRIDYRPFIIADADTGHGGEAHVRNLIRRFVEVGVPGYHIEDQKPGCKKCGHQGGKVLVSIHEQITRLNAARFQLDIMDVEGIIVARTDAEAATLLDNNSDERDHPFILGATHPEIPSLKIMTISLFKHLSEMGLTQVNGHDLYQLSSSDYERALHWMKKTNLLQPINQEIQVYLSTSSQGCSIEALINTVTAMTHDSWEKHARLCTLEEAIATAMNAQIKEGQTFDMTLEDWKIFTQQHSIDSCKEKAKSLGLDVFWDAELARTPEGYYQIRGGIPYATARSLAVAPYADLLWMETKTADLTDAKKFADGIHQIYPDKMLAYNLSPSFNWDTTGMSDDEMKSFPEKLGQMGFVFNFITYGGHQIDGSVSEDFAAALKEEGMLALARLQRKFRLIESAYKTPQSLVGGPRLDAALMAATGRTATTKAMGKGSTQSQHLVQIEAPLSILDHWIGLWKEHHHIKIPLFTELRPQRRGSDLLQLNLCSDSKNLLANVIFDIIHDRRNRMILSIRDQNNFDERFRQKRLMTLIHLYLLHRYRVSSVHYVSPTDANQKQTEGMQALGIYRNVDAEIGKIIVASVDSDTIQNIISNDGAIEQIIAKHRQN